MSWRTMEVQDQRVRFVIAASRGEQNMSELCREFDISRPTGYQWLRRYRTAGVAGIREESRRPRRSPRRTVSAIEQRIAELRGGRPDWGARKLAFLLEQEGIAVPRATVHRVLLRLGLVRLEDRRSAASSRFQREQPNQLWQMDFKSPKGWGSKIGPLLSVVEPASFRWLDAAFGVADEAEHTALFFWRAPSSDAGQGRAFPWSSGDGSQTARLTRGVSASALAG